MKAIKVSEATNIQLDWLVAKCEGHRVIYWGAGPSARLAYIPKRSAYKVWRPSSNPVQMWPIIEREKIDCMADPNGRDVWKGRLYRYKVEYYRYGATALIAAARCFVASKLGELVEVPGELLANRPPTGRWYEGT